MLISLTTQAPLLRNLRARLAATHAPNVALKRDLTTFAGKNLALQLSAQPVCHVLPIEPAILTFFFTGTFEKRYKELEDCLKENQQLQLQLKRDERDLEQRIKTYEEERKEFEEERAIWKEELDRDRLEAIEQNDRLTVLSEQLAGVKVCQTF